ncbi:unnamed protein product [Lasius platythorax]|uniref:Uncharacterized protein n=1 Tax=Lasius platythorax TaxID=488582 RepID=A0AAV2NR07_9HYME
MMRNFFNNPDAKIFITNNGDRKFCMLCRTKTLLAGPIGTEAASQIRSPPTEGRNSPEGRSSHRNDAETTTYFANSGGNRGSPA